MKKTFALLIPLLLCMGCMKEEEGRPGTDLCFEAEVADAAPGVKSEESGLWSDGILSVSLREESIAGYATKAAPLATVPDEIRVYGYRYRAPWTGSEAPGLLRDAVLKRSGSRWYPSSPVLTGPGGTDLSMRFYACAPASARGLEIRAASGAPVLEHTVPENVADQVDILSGSSGEMPASGGSVSLGMRHILSSVTFAVDDSCSDCRVTGITLQGIYCSAEYSDDGGWTGHGTVSSRSLATDAAVAEGAAASLTGGASTMMLIPQTLPDGAVLRITVEKEGETYSLDAPIAGGVWEEGRSYVYRLSFVVNLWDSTFTYRIRMGHTVGMYTGGATIQLPAMYFEPDTEMVSVDWGDGTTSEFTSSPASAMQHYFAAGHEGDVVVRVRGASPRIIIQGNHVQRIARVNIVGSDRYDSRDGCNCIIESASGNLIYAGIEYTIPSCVRTICQCAMATVEDFELVIPEGVTCLYPNAVCGPNAYMRHVHIPASMTTIYDGAFEGNDIHMATVDEANPVYDSRRDCGCILETATDMLVLGTRYMEFPEETKGARPYACSTNPKYTVVLPPSFLELLPYAFSNNASIGDISIPAGSRIGAYAFRGCGFKSVDVPEGCIMEEYAFCYSNYLNTASLHCAIEGDCAFFMCQVLSSIDLWDGFSASGQHNFQGCPLTEIRCHCSTPPVVGGFDLTRPGTLHIPAGADWSGWIAGHGFVQAGWTIVKDL